MQKDKGQKLGVYTVKYPWIVTKKTAEKEKLTPISAPMHRRVHGRYKGESTIKG